MKKLFSIFFLFIFLFNVILFYPVFLLMQSDAKEEMNEKIKQNIPENELSVISLNEKENKSIEWLDKSEFRLNGNRYDVVKTKKENNGTISYYCINDSKENNLFASFDNHVENNVAANTVPNKNAKKTLNDFLKNFLISEKNISVPDFFKIEFPTINCKLQTVSISFLSPPPELG